MTTFGKTLLSGVIALIVTVAIYGAYQYPIAQQVAGTSPTGTTYNTAKFAAAVISLASAGANGTSTSLYNGDANDRYVSSAKIGCEGVGTSKTAYTGTGLAALTYTIGTSSTAAPATFTGFANIANAVTLATATVDVLVASSTTATATSTLATIWPAGSYMTFTFNATNTAACTVGVEYFGN